MLGTGEDRDAPSLRPFSLYDTFTHSLVSLLPSSTAFFRSRVAVYDRSATFACFLSSASRSASLRADRIWKRSYQSSAMRSPLIGK